MKSKEYKTLKELEGFLNELRILLYDKFYKKDIDGDRVLGGGWITR